MAQVVSRQDDLCLDNGEQIVYQFIYSTCCQSMNVRHVSDMFCLFKENTDVYKKVKM
jgi:hypothetical protein